MKVRHEVTAIHPDKKTVSVKNLQTGEEFEESYDKLILSPGAKPTQPRLPGLGLDKLFTLRTVEDTFRIKDYININHPKSAVLAGGGFIGLELAENLRELGMEVTIVQRPKQLMNPFDSDMAAFIHNEMRKHGVKLALGHTVEGVAEVGGGVDVLLKDEQPLHADMVILAIGVSPETGLAKAAGLELGIKGSILVNDRMETSAPDIYAVGDAVQVKHFVTGQDALISLAGPANKQGRIAADNICGGDSHYTGSQGSSVIKVFGMTAATTGVNEANARKAGLDVDTVILSPMSHAGYYPGGKVMTMKVVFEKETYRLLGAQIVGYEGVDKRIDVLATAIRAGMKAPELKDLDLAYAPPYSSAKDPVNMAGFMIENIAKGILKQWYLEDTDKLPRDGSVTLLDTRTVEEFTHGLLWSSFFVTLVAKKIVLINLCCRPCFIWGSITIITVWTNMIIINVCKFFYLLIECFLCCKLIQICAFILQGIEITLHRCIVVRISCFAHALCHIYRFAEFGKCFGRIL